MSVLNTLIMKKLSVLFTAFILLQAMFLVSCSKETDATVEYAVQDFEIVLEGPLFKGSNEAQVKLPFSPDEVLKLAGYDKKNIKDIKIKDVSLSIQDQDNFNMLESLVIQLVGGDAPLTSVAVLSPVPQNVKQQSPPITDKASFSGFKDADSFYFVIDANLREDFEENVKLKGKMTFNIQLVK